MPPKDARASLGTARREGCSPPAVLTQPRRHGGRARPRPGRFVHQVRGLARGKSARTARGAPARAKRAGARMRLQGPAGNANARMERKGEFVCAW